jgi:hypothetical protein
MGRKVSVSLEANVAGFVTPVESAKKSADDLGDKIDRLDRELDKIPPDAAKAAAAMKLLGTEADSAGKKVGDIGDKRTQLAALDSKIRETRGEVRKLADEFNKDGNVDVFRKLGDAQGRLSALSKIRKDLASEIENGLKDGFNNPGSWEGIGPVAAHFGAALGPALLAAAGGALAGGVGLGVGGLGLAGAILGDPQKYADAWHIASHSVKNDFLDATSGFSDQVFNGLARIGPLVESWNLKKIFHDAQAYAQPLFAGIEGLSTGLVRGIGALVEKGGPAVDTLSDSMIGLGHASESALTSIADGAKGGAYALHDLMTGVDLVIEGFGKLTFAAEKAYEYVHDNPLEAAAFSGGASIPLSLYQMANGETHKLVFNQKGLEEQAKAAGHAFSEQGDDLTALSQKMGAAALTTDTLAGAMENKLFTALMNIDQATLGIAESLTRVQDSFKQNGRELDIHTAKGQANRESVLASVSANQQLYQAQIAAGLSAEDAAAQYDANTRSLEAQLKKAGLTQDKIDGLIGKYRDIPDTVNTTIVLEGLTKAIEDLDHTLRLMAGIKDKDVFVRVHNVVYNDTTGQRVSGNSRLGGQPDYALGGIRRAAVGMLIAPSDPGTVLTAEPQTGGEALIPLRGISQNRAMGLAQVVGNNYGFSVGGGGMPRELVLQATFLDPHTGDVMRRQAIRWSIDRGRDPGDFFTAS